MEQEQLFEENDIVNKEYYEGIKDMIMCSICLDIVKDPVQCDKCQHCFCLKCTEELKNCPFRCENSRFIPSFICKQLLSELKIKCKCGKEISCDFLKNHKEKDCIVNYKEKYLNLKKEYDLIMQRKIKISDYNDYIKSRLHNHPIECVKRIMNPWFCDNCKKEFNVNIPSYRCTLCDFDLCYYCAKETVIEGIVEDEIVKFLSNCT